MSSLVEHYDLAVAQGRCQDNPNQRKLLPFFQDLLDQLQEGRRFWQRWQYKALARGIYLYGSVGVGKTFLVDFFYQHCPIAAKKRQHFHSFMQWVDAELRRLQGVANPLERIADQLAKSCRLLFLDEFMVQDIAHAMILAELLKALRAQGIALVITSNAAPDELYQGGLQRQRFLPAIELLKSDCELLRFAAEAVDYRSQKTLGLDAYQYPLNTKTDQKMASYFEQLAAGDEHQNLLELQGRAVQAIRVKGKAVCFAFDLLCNIPRSQLDYLELADRYDCFFLLGLPSFSMHNLVAQRLFIHFIDVMYDRRKMVFFSAAVSLDTLASQASLDPALNRCLSRLREMISPEYLQSFSR